MIGCWIRKSFLWFMFLGCFASKWTEPPTWAQSLDPKYGTKVSQQQNMHGDQIQIRGPKRCSAFFPVGFCLHSPRSPRCFVGKAKKNQCKQNPTGKKTSTTSFGTSTLNSIAVRSAVGGRRLRSALARVDHGSFHFRCFCAEK